MLETSYAMNFFLKKPSKPTKMRMIYARVTVDGYPQETSTNRKWDPDRWDNKNDKAIGNREDAKSINAFLEAMVSKVNNYRTELGQLNEPITSQKIIDLIKGRTQSRKKVLEEFQIHNDQIKALVPEQYAKGTHERYVTARSHVAEFIQYKYGKDDMEFRELDYEFISDYEFYLRTVRKCSKNTALKYISNFKKIVLRAKKKKILKEDPFADYLSVRDKIKKKPLTSEELERLEKHNFTIDRLDVIRDIFVFQCYTGLAYIDVYQLKKHEIKVGEDGEFWIYSDRQKSDAALYIPLLPKAIAILKKYENHPLCISRGSALPVRSNQKMNAYLKEIADILGFKFTLNTHTARRTFASTVTLNNNVPINVVKELLGHSTVKQTEDYAITEQQAISKSMAKLKIRLQKKEKRSKTSPLEAVQDDLNQLKKQFEVILSGQGKQPANTCLVSEIQTEISKLKDKISLAMLP